MRNCFKCCFIGRGVSRDEDNNTPDVESNDSVSMISVTYGLESFTKNAMLLFCQVTSERGSRNREMTMSEADVLKETFQKYRFDVETHFDLTSSEVEETCNEFFARDFSEYGALAVVVLAVDGKSRFLSASDEMFHESVILKHFTSELPLTLRGKPKIYITEANRMNISKEVGIENIYEISVPIKDCYEDILSFHIPSVIEDKYRSPLRLFCDRMKTSEDHGNLIGIVIGSLDEIEETFPELKDKLELYCTFIKRFTLPMFLLLDNNL